MNFLNVSWKAAKSSQSSLNKNRATLNGKIILTSRKDGRTSDRFKTDKITGNRVRMFEPCRRIKLKINMEKHTKNQQHLIFAYLVGLLLFLDLKLLTLLRLVRKLELWDTQLLCRLL